jgi:hypothetical protein
MSKETFLQLFPLSGLWGEKVWKEFDLFKFERIDYRELIMGLSTHLSLPGQLRADFLVFCR